MVKEDEAKGKLKMHFIELLLLYTKWKGTRKISIAKSKDNSRNI